MAALQGVMPAPVLRRLVMTYPNLLARTPTSLKGPLTTLQAGSKGGGGGRQGRVPR